MALEPIKKDTSVTPITPQSNNANAEIYVSNCWKNGRHVHVFLNLKITGTITQATAADLVKGFPPPSEIKYGMVAQVVGTLASGMCALRTDGLLRQTAIGTLSAGDYVLFYLDYCI